MRYLYKMRKQISILLSIIMVFSLVNISGVTSYAGNSGSSGQEATSSNALPTATDSEADIDAIPEYSIYAINDYENKDHEQSYERYALENIFNSDSVSYEIRRATPSNLTESAINGQDEEDNLKDWIIYGDHDLIVGDDVLSIDLESDTRFLTDDEYDIRAITIPKDSADVDYEIWVAYAQQDELDAYELLNQDEVTEQDDEQKVYTGNTSVMQRYELPVGVKAFYVKYIDTEYKYQYHVQPEIEFHLDYEFDQSLPEEYRIATEGKITNYVYLRDIVDDIDVISDTYEDEVIEEYDALDMGTDLADHDSDIYDNLVMRNISNIYLDGSVVSYYNASQNILGGLASLLSSGNGGATSIDNLSIQFVSGADDISGKKVWTPAGNASGHNFIYRVNYTASVIDAIPEGRFIIRVPAHILKDSNGNYADMFDIAYPSKDEVDQMTDSEKESGDGYAYYIDGNELVVYNYKDVDAISGYFEIAYATTKNTYNYKDYGSAGAASDVFYADMAVKKNNSDSDLTARVQGPEVYINTKAAVQTTVKNYPNLYTTWDNAWGPAPSDAADYNYLIWNIRTTMASPTTQKYTFTLNDTPDAADYGQQLVGYKMSGQSKYTLAGNTLTNQTIDGYRYDNVLTRFKKSDVAGLTSYSIDNKITATVVPADGVDPQTTASASKTFTWTKPTFSIPTGSFNIYKYGNENGHYGSYSRYDLEELQSGRVSSMDVKYDVYGIGKSFPFTLKDGGSSTNPADYGFKKVSYEITDDTLFLLPNGDTTFSDVNYTGPNGKTPLSAQDYDITEISYRVVYTDAERNPDGTVRVIDDGTKYGFNLINHVYTSDDQLTLKIKVNGSWIDAATYNLGTYATTINDAHVISMTGNLIKFADGVDGYKIVSSENNYYQTEITATPTVRLYNTAAVLAVTGTGDAEDLTGYPTTNGVAPVDIVMLKNVANMKVAQSGSELFDLSYIIGDRLRRSVKNSSISKRATGAYNNKLKRQYNINWRVTMSETLTAGMGSTEYLNQSSGIFYDLLPSGSELQNESVAIWAGTQMLDEADYSIETIPNYEGCGRTMLVVKVTEPGDYYTVSYNTVHSWDSIADFGKNVLNPVAYETGNTSITAGYPDDGGNLSAENKTLMSDLDNASGTDRKFIYSEARNDISALMAASSGLKKAVKSDFDSDYVRDTVTKQNGTYKYRLRYANTAMTTSKNMVLYDTIEDAQNSDGVSSGWYGSLQSVDVSQMKLMGVDPVIYYATETVDLSDENNKDLNASHWHVLTAATDMSTIKSIAIDASKDTNGDDYILNSKASVSAVLVMKAPDGLSIQDDNPYAYNNVYMSTTVMDTEGLELDSYFSYGTTSVKLQVMSGFNLHKSNADDPNESVKGITYRLYGTSDYGNIVDIKLKTNAAGMISFENIEKGTYLLSEYETTDDWQMNYSQYTVKVAQQLNPYVQIDSSMVEYSTDKSGIAFEVSDKPRVHANILFSKRNLIEHTQAIGGVKFKLTGTSDYGNDVLMYATSTTGYGVVEFKNIEKGTYILTEISTDGNYILAQNPWTVTISDDGSYGIAGSDCETDGTYNYLLYNEPKHNVTFIKKSSYDGMPVAGATFSLTGVSDYGNNVSASATSTATGQVIFTDLEPGTYVLEETAAPAGFVLNNTQYIVVVERNQIQGTISSVSNGVITNQKLSNDTIVVTKKWVGKDPSVTIMPEIHISTEDPTPAGSVTYVYNYIGAPSPNVVYYKTGNVEVSGTYSLPDRGSISFAGWYTDSACTAGNEFSMTGGTPNVPTTAITDDIIVYAKWNEPVATLLPGMSFYMKVYSAIGYSALGELKTVTMSDIEPDASNKQEANIVSTADSDTPVYAWYDSGTNELKLWSESKKIYLNEDSQQMFAFSAVTDISGLRELDSSRVTNMCKMFYNCRSLTDLSPLSNWNTSKVENMSQMFINCGSLTDLSPLSNWNTSKVENMSQMFNSCKSLNSLEGLSDWDMSHVTNTNKMFYNCVGLTALTGLDDWRFASGVNMSEIFSGCKNLTDLNALSEWTFNNANLASMFMNCTSLENINALSSWDMTQVNSIVSMFQGDTALDDISGASSWDVSNVKYMIGTFHNTGVTNLSSISGWRPSQVTTMQYMFADCSNLTNIDALKDWTITSLTDMSNMFRGCSNLTDIDGIKDWDVSNITDMQSLFRDCSKLENINDLSGWNTTNVTTMRQMFEGSSHILDFSPINSWDISHVALNEFYYMLNGCSAPGPTGVGQWIGTWDADGTFTKTP